MTETTVDVLNLVLAGLHSEIDRDQPDHDPVNTKVRAIIAHVEMMRDARAASVRAGLPEGRRET